jgi:hypothetical protein
VRDHAAATVTGKTIGNTHICSKIRINITLTIIIIIIIMIIVKIIMAIIIAANTGNISKS